MNRCDSNLNHLRSLFNCHDFVGCWCIITPTLVLPIFISFSAWTSLYSRWHLSGNPMISISLVDWVSWMRGDEKIEWVMWKLMINFLLWSANKTLLTWSNALEKSCFLSFVIIRWFGTTINVSTDFFISSIPFSAINWRSLPSYLNGVVTMPMHNTPESINALPITGNAPVPVPPPIPAVTKHKCESFNLSTTNSRSSSAACLPISGRDPAPKPSVNLVPSWILLEFGNFDISSTWESVLQM